MDKIKGFCGKLKLCLQHIASGSTEMFPTVCSLAAGIKLISVIEHVNALQGKFSDYFEKSVEDFNWVHVPFGVLATFPHLKVQELPDLKVDRTIKLKFRELSLDIFWPSLKEEYLVISEMAVRILLPFSTTYLSELINEADTYITLRQQERVWNV
jgi:hypothetical protein